MTRKRLTGRNILTKRTSSSKAAGLFCTLHYDNLSFTILCYTMGMNFITDFALYCTVLYCTVLYCTLSSFLTLSHPLMLSSTSLILLLFYRLILRSLLFYLLLFILFLFSPLLSIHLLLLFFSLMFVLCSIIFCRYYGIAIVNSLGKKLKLPKGSVTITYQIHR